MSLTIQQIITDAKQLAGRLKERDVTADLIINDSQAIIKKVHELKQYEDEVEQLNEVAQQRPHSELIANIQKENRHLREIQQENRNLRAALEEHQIAIEHIMSKYRQHVSKQLYKSRIHFVNLHDKKYDEIIKQQAEKIHEMAAVMDQAALIDENKFCRDEEVMSRLRTENQGLREMLEISCSYGSYQNRIKNGTSEDKNVQTEKESTATP